MRKSTIQIYIITQNNINKVICYNNKKNNYFQNCIKLKVSQN